jgi:DNA modification methylase
MVKNYLIELTFVILEMYRTCQSGAYVILVNDLVKYSGEIIPIDTFFTEVAEEIGFSPITIYILPQRKGNSSQQMGKFGRIALRKSITVWQKPE